MGVYKKNQWANATSQMLSFFDTLLETSTDGILISDASNNIVVVNKTFCQFVNKTETELTNTPLWNWMQDFGGDAITCWQQLHQQTIQKGSCSDLEFHLPTEKGLRYLHVNASAINNGKNKEGYIVSIWRDITKRVEALKAKTLLEKQLRKTEVEQSKEELAKVHSLLYAAVEQSSAGVIVVDALPQKTILLANSIALEILGESASELTELNCSPTKTQNRFFKPSGEPFTTEELPLCQALKHGKTIKNLEMVVHPKKSEDFSLKAARKKRWILCSASPVTDPTGKIIAGVLVFPDITIRKKEFDEKQKLKDQLQQSKKMKAIGQLAGGVAHDINNVLGAIMSTASLLYSNSDLDDENLEDVSNILEACKRGRNLTRNLLGFARKGKYKNEKFSFNSIIEESRQILGTSIGKNITLTEILTTNLSLVKGDHNQLMQLLMNLCMNASDAMPNGGNLTIHTKNISLGSKTTSAWNSVPDGDYVQLKVIDTGHGMDEESLEHVFEPFFTTKPMEKGTGLGLSMVFGTIKNHNGYIKIDSKPGKGTTVSILLPAFEKDATKPILFRPRPKSAKSDNKNACVLLVEDESLVRASGSRVLQALGYCVLLAENGLEALEVYKEHIHEIDLVVLDLIMPKMDGLETFDRLQLLDPDVNILISSGYDQDDRVESLLLNGAKGFIQKPFELSLFSKMVEKAIKEGSPRLTQIPISS